MSWKRQEEQVGGEGVWTSSVPLVVLCCVTFAGCRRVFEKWLTSAFDLDFETSTERALMNEAWQKPAESFHPSLQTQQRLL